MKNLTLSICILVITGMLVGGIAMAALTGDITATVTAQNVAITASDGAIAYGIIAIGSNADTTATGVNDTQTVTNDGNVAGDISVIGSDTGVWTLESAIGSEQYVHKSCTTTCDASATWAVFNADTYTTLNDDVAASATVELDL